MKWVKLILSLLLVTASAVLCARIISTSSKNKLSKIDLAEVNDVKYGLLSIDEWKLRITEILASEIDKVDLSAISQKEIREHVEKLLNTIIDKVAKNMKNGNKGSVGGWVKQSLIDTFVSVDDIKKGIPEYTDAIMHEMTDRKTSQQLKSALNDQLKKYSTGTKGTIDQSRRQAIVTATESKTVAEARSKLEGTISTTNSLIARYSLVLIVLSVLVFAIAGSGKGKLLPTQYLILLVILSLLLVAGVTTPMIDMEAKISKMSFVLMGHPLNFTNQVLYFQSKSIWDVFLIMMEDDDLQMKTVGILMVTFSIVFPVMKILSSVFYYFNFRNAKDNRIIKFFVHKSGKWSMTDVTVVAIFMAYIGFNGIINSKLGDLSSADEGPILLTTNGTNLQPGYYIFMAYALLALILSEFLTRKRQVPVAREQEKIPA